MEDKKLLTNIEAYDFDFDNLFDRPIEETVQMILDIKKEKEAEGWSGLNIQYYEYYEGGSDKELRGDRMETDDEYDKRINGPKRKEEIERKKRLTMYNKLKKEFS